MYTGLYYKTTSAKGQIVFSKEKRRLSFQVIPIKQAAIFSKFESAYTK